jgi:hypothetical protein
VGQGARISGAPEKYFILKKLPHSGDLLVGRGVDHPALFCNALDVSGEEFNWIHGSPPLDPSLPPLSSESPIQQFLAEFQCRHQQQPIPCRVSLIFSSRDSLIREPSPLPLSSAPSLRRGSSSSSSPPVSSSVVIRVDPLDEVMVRCPVPGQTLVLYQGEVCLGGGPIRNTYSSYFQSLDRETKGEILHQVIETDRSKD